MSGVILAQTGQPYSNAIGGDSVNDTNSQTSRVPRDGELGPHHFQLGPAPDEVDSTLSRPDQSALALDAFSEAEFLAGNIRNGKYNFSAATGLFTPATNFGTYANQTLDNRILRVSGKITF